MPINLQPAFTVNIGGTGTSEAYQFNSEGMVEIVPTSEGYDGMLRVTVNALNNKWLKPNGKVPDATVVNDTTFNVKEYATMDAPHQVFTDKDIIERQTRFANLQRVEIPAGTTRMTPLFRSHSNLQEVILPPSCTEIMSDAFRDCRKLEKINLDNVTSIGNGAFYYCLLLKDINLSNSLNTLDKQAFYSCNSLESITIPNTITEIPNSCFNYCTNLAEVNLPNTLISINGSAFSNCSKLKNINLPSSLTTLKGFIFSSSGLTSLTIPSSVLQINTQISGLCQECKSLKSVIFESGSNITSIDNDAFRGCIELETVVLPENLNYISSCVFKNCNKLAEITIPANWGNNNLGSGVFSIDNGQPDVPLTLTLLKSNRIIELAYGVNGTNGTFNNRTINKIRVPADLVAAYKADSKWSVIADKIEAI